MGEQSERSDQRLRLLLFAKQPQATLAKQPGNRALVPSRPWARRRPPSSARITSTSCLTEAGGGAPSPAPAPGRRPARSRPRQGLTPLGPRRQNSDPATDEVAAPRAPGRRRQHPPEVPRSPRTHLPLLAGALSGGGQSWRCSDAHQQRHPNPAAGGAAGPAAECRRHPGQYGQRSNQPHHSRGAAGRRRGGPHGPWHPNSNPAFPDIEGVRRDPIVIRGPKGIISPPALTSSLPQARPGQLP